VLPHGKPERDRRALQMVSQMNAEGFGNCTNIGECTGVCPKQIQLEVIAVMNRDYLRASINRRDELPPTISPFTEWSTGSKFSSTTARE
jgi:succinate dehydrogenase / fumarate reductase iron-sulfur subunit